MPKYYVDAGELRQVVDASDPKKAAIEAFRTLEHNPVGTLNSFTVVSEEGFDTNSGDEWCFSTLEILEQSDQWGQYDF